MSSKCDHNIEYCLRKELLNLHRKVSLPRSVIRKLAFQIHKVVPYQRYNVESTL